MKLTFIIYATLLLVPWRSVFSFTLRWNACSQALPSFEPPFFPRTIYILHLLSPSSSLLLPFQVAGGVEATFKTSCDKKMVMTTDDCASDIAKMKAKLGALSDYGTCIQLDILHILNVENGRKNARPLTITITINGTFLKRVISSSLQSQGNRCTWNLLSLVQASTPPLLVQV